jgi:hypothetical protein
MPANLPTSRRRCVSCTHPRQDDVTVARYRRQDFPAFRPRVKRLCSSFLPDVASAVLEPWISCQ